MPISHSDVAGLLRKHGYVEKKKIGEGSFGKAILVQASDGSSLVCKMVDVSKRTPKETQDAVKEGKLLSQLKHPYIVRYRESFVESGWLCIVMDYCEGGELTKKIKDAKKSGKIIPEEQVLRWITQALLALKYIHDKHVLHRDLKPGNFFLAKNGCMKMGDFGIAKVLSSTVACARTQIGTPYYLSPEVCQEKPYAWPSDIWAVGCILYELCARRVPFDAPNIPGLVQKICRGPVPQIPQPYSDFTKKLCTEMLNRNPSARPSADDVLQRPRIQAIVRQMLDEAQAEKGAGGGDEVAAAMPSHANPKASPAPPPLPSAPSAPSGPPSARAGGGAYRGTAGGYRRYDLVEYLSMSHREWLPATVVKAEDGKIVLDLKPNTWISAEEQAVKVRPRRGESKSSAGGRAADSSPLRRPSPAGSRNSSPMQSPVRTPSQAAAAAAAAGGVASPSPRWGKPPASPGVDRESSRAGSRAPSPGREPARGGGSRAASPRPEAGQKGGSPHMRPPCLPPRGADSPLRRQNAAAAAVGVAIAGA
eukprot:TRINITY_DN3658_c0_g3_i1.p1 TRINITY_DN3658_c0_g3~~TRINITY_DN3658_c0_g3_i1.p1  ORF type:complete len:534 (+),score=103.25 TRINITY_DN3658_c0_g3_i1:187-1788(+)